MCVCVCCFCFFQAEDGIRDLVRSRGLGDVYKRQTAARVAAIDQAVTDGTLTQEQADALKSGTGRMDGRGIAPILSLIHI